MSRRRSRDDPWMPKPATHAQIVEAPFGFLPPPEESATATLTGTTPTRITRALGGIKPHELWGKHERRDGPQFDYVDYFWAFTYDGVYCRLWSHYNTARHYKFYFAGPPHVPAALFPDAIYTPVNVEDDT